MNKKYTVTITHDNRKRTLLMEFKDKDVHLGIESEYFLHKAPSYADIKEGLEKAAITTVTAYDALGPKRYNEMVKALIAMTPPERQALLSIIKVKHPKGLLPTFIYKEV